MMPAIIGSVTDRISDDIAALLAHLALLVLFIGNKLFKKA